MANVVAHLFSKSLSDLIRGIRASKRNEDAYIASCIEEIRQEIKTSDPDVKTQAVSKLLYLHLMGYDMSWASFHVVEVMSSPKFAYKRIGYLAASQTFRQDTDVLIMCTNLIKKDMASHNYLEVGLALSGLSQIVTPDLARDLLPDIIALLNHSRPYIRKKVVLLLYKMFLKYPDGLKQAWPRLKTKLEDEDAGVVSSVVNVVCELAAKNPSNYILVAPQLYSLMNATSSNNWTLIKIVKLFGVLMPLEPRLGKKLVQPLSQLISSTTAMSLLYECIYAVVNGGLLTMENFNPSQLSTLCITKLRLFLEDSDPNLKYLGLVVLAKLLPINPAAVMEHRDVVLKCLEDADTSIRMRALDIVTSMVTQKNIKDLVRRLISHLDHANLDAHYRLEVVNRIVDFCSNDTYELVQDFEWYVDVLVDLVRHSHVDASKTLSNQFMDVAVRVANVRDYLVMKCCELLADSKLLDTAGQASSNVSVLQSCAWICGEFCTFLTEPEFCLKSLMTMDKLPPATQGVYVQAALKIWVHLSGKELNPELTIELIEALKKVKGGDMEVTTRASTIAKLIQNVQDDPRLLQSLPVLFQGDLKPVAPKAQSRVPLPEGLNLDGPFYPIPFEEKRQEREKKEKKEKMETEEERRRRKKERMEKMKSDPFYLDTAQEIPIVKLEKMEISETPKVREKVEKEKRPTKIYQVEKAYEAPDGTVESVEKVQVKKKLNAEEAALGSVFLEQDDQVLVVDKGEKRKKKPKKNVVLIE